MGEVWLFEVAGIIAATKALGGLDGLPKEQDEEVA